MITFTIDPDSLTLTQQEGLLGQAVVFVVDFVKVMASVALKNLLNWPYCCTLPSIWQGGLFQLCPLIASEQNGPRITQIAQI
ncbi:MAG: hypothetical protein H7144_01305 [Burkholderiales bacterium]|nr:hypothetical protein [Phycisphaerae bacterium]